jgi:hypothetical protein
VTEINEIAYIFFECPKKKHRQEDRPIAI